MSGYEASCPACGGTLVFELGSSLLRICEHCGVAVARKGADLASYGRVAELIPTPSVLSLGATGGYEGAPPFSLVGRLQLDHGAGTWDEWLMAFRDGTWAWLSESQGRFHYMGQAALPPSPNFEDIQVGQTLDLGPPGTFVVAEVRSARFMTAAGELPFDVAPGSLLNYADLSGPGGQFGTLDYGTGSSAEALYVGREVKLDELGMRGLPSSEERRKAASGKALSCPQCGGPIEIKAPDQTQRVACPYCGSLLDATKDLAVLEALASVPVKPLIPLGSKGRFDGHEWTIIGFMERSVTVEGERYPWHEYLLYDEGKGFRWLVEANGHWSFVESLNPGDVEAGGSSPTYGGRAFKHFQSGEARVDHVIGEFYWAVARGDATESADYVDAPHMLSREKDENEVHWSFGTYKTPQEIKDAFALPAPPSDPVGVAPSQPWPLARDSKTVVRYSFLALALVFVVYLGLAMTGGKVVHNQKFSIPPTAVPASAEAAVFSERFFVLSGGNLQVQVTAPVNNSWLYLDGALINEETGEMDEFDAELSYYYGSDSDGSWAEGSGQATRYIASVPPGRYILRLGPQWEAGRNPGGFTVQVRSRVPRFWHAFLAMLAICVWPVIMAWRKLRFEAQRWSESDHPIFGSE